MYQKSASTLHASAPSRALCNTHRSLLSDHPFAMFNFLLRMDAISALHHVMTEDVANVTKRANLLIFYIQKKPIYPSLQGSLTQNK